MCRGGLREKKREGKKVREGEMEGGSCFSGVACWGVTMGYQGQYIILLGSRCQMKGNSVGYGADPGI